MSKAYDRIEWNFLKRILLALGFDSKWVQIVMGCVSSVSYRVKINGSTSALIQPQRGLRQGDPISPYLFLFCAEWLSLAIDHFHLQGRLRGVSICRGHHVLLTLCLLMIVFFFEATRISVSTIQDILLWYESISCQKINFLKSKLVAYKDTRNDVLA